jgi:hypothetical protein
MEQIATSPWQNKTKEGKSSSKDKDAGIMKSESSSRNI